eukprot:894437_1
MLFDVFQQYPAAMPVLATVGGLIIGSFLNVVIWSYPIMLRQQMSVFHGEMPSAQSKISLALPRSHCPHCQQTIRVRDNIPLFSWLMLKGRCRDCQAKISKRYPLVELLTALAFLLASLVWPESGWALAVMILSAWLIAASVIDLDHQWHCCRAPWRSDAIRDEAHHAAVTNAAAGDLGSRGVVICFCRSMHEKQTLFRLAVERQKSGNR